MIRYLLVVAFILSCYCQQAQTAIVVYNIPPDIAPPRTGGNAQINLFDGGTLPDNFTAGFNGGTPNLEINLNGGTVGANFIAYNGTVVNVRGGNLRRNFSGDSFSKINFFGAEFQQNGVAVSGNVSVPDNALITGTLSDGSVVIFWDKFDFANVTMTPTAVPAAGPAIINAPSDPSPRALRAGQTLNLAPGGVVGHDFRAVNATINVDGGSIGNQFDAARTNITMSSGSIGDGAFLFPGSNLTMSGGTLGNGGSSPTSALIFENSTLNLSGGTVGKGLRALTNGHVNLIGGEFLRNGVPVSGNAIMSGGTISGTLADGTVVIFSSLAGDSLPTGVLNLVPAALPPAAPLVITSPSDPTPKGLRFGQTLNLNSGASLGNNFAAVGATLNITGGLVGNDLEVSNTSVHMTSGEIGNGFVAHPGSTVTVDGGQVGNNLLIAGGSTVNVNGGTLGNNPIAQSGAVLNIAGGRFGSLPSMSGTVKFHGGEFFRDNSPISGSANLSGGRVLTGTLADGSVFIVSSLVGDGIGSVGLVSSLLPSLQPVINAPSDPVPKGLRPTQTLNLGAGANLGHDFGAVKSTLNIQGGSVGDRMQTSQATIEITSGSIGDNLSLFNGSTLTALGGTIGNSLAVRRNSELIIDGASVGSGLFLSSSSSFSLLSGAVGDDFNVFGFFQSSSNCTVEIAGGSIGDRFTAVGLIAMTGGEIGNNFSTSGEFTMSGGIIGDDATFASRVNIFDGTFGDRVVAGNYGVITISGGTFGDGFSVVGETFVTISGGTFGNAFSARRGSTLRILGQSFALDGVDITDDLIANGRVPFLDRDALLTGILADGSPISFDLNSVQGPGDFFDSQAKLILGIVPEPSSLILFAICGGIASLRRQNRRLRPLRM